MQSYSLAHSNRTSKQINHTIHIITPVPLPSCRLDRQIQQLAQKQSIQSTSPLSPTPHSEDDAKFQQTRSQTNSYQLPSESQQFLTLQKRCIQLQSNLQSALKEQNLLTNIFSMLGKIEEGQMVQTKKRHRRHNKDIQLKVTCKVQGCNKSYASQTSLARHRKLKHSLDSKPPQHNYQVPPSPNLIQQEEQSQELEPDAVTKKQIKQDISL